MEMVVILMFLGCVGYFYAQHRARKAYEDALAQLASNPTDHVGKMRVIETGRAIGISETVLQTEIMARSQ